MKLLAVLTLGMVSCAFADFNVYVATDAPVGGNGGVGAPYQTLLQARDGIRAARKAGTLKAGEAATVQVGAGVYRFDTTFELRAEDGGTADAPVTYRAQAHGKVHFHGGVTLAPEAFTPVTDERVLARLDPVARGKVLVCDLSARGKFDTFKNAYTGVPVGPWLYVDSQPMTLARWPNADAPEAGWASFSKAVDNGLPKADATDPALRKLHPGSFILEDTRPKRWNLEEGVWLLGYWTHDWSDEVIRIASYDKEKQRITLAAPHNYGINGGTWGAAKRRFFALNLLEELDAPGEWYLDRAGKRLYFYPPKPLKGSLIVLATLSQPLVKVNDARHIKLVGLGFESAHSDGIVLQNTENVEIAGCVVANCAGDGISVNGKGNTVRSCELFNLGKGGIMLNGGDRKTLTAANNLALNNHIHHYGIFKRTYAPGIGVQGCGQIVRNNCIHDAPHNAVLYGGNEHLFELNEIYRVVMETGDSGAFYTGRDWTSQGNILRHNYIHDLGGGDSKHVNTMGVYLDDCDCGDTIEGNVFYRAGRAIMIGGGRDNPILNNLVVDCPIGLHMDARGMTWKQWNNPADSSWSLEAKAKRLNYTEPPWSQKYPRLAAIMQEEPRQPLNNPIRRNVFVDCSKQVCDFDGNVKKLLDKFAITDNLAVNTSGAKTVAMAANIKGFGNVSGSPEKVVDLGFTAAKQGDFTLRKGARLLQELPAFEPMPFAKIGLFKDEYRRELPTR
ncbi:MAG: right-handed parallel beta-helix repeat-containing protein [Verrucomicrobiota bacterium]